MKRGPRLARNGSRPSRPRKRRRAWATGCTKAKVRAELAKEAGVQPNEVAFTDVGPSWGKEISNKAIRALIFFFIAISIYISARFEWKMAVSALVAVVHDIVVTVGVYSLTGL